MTEATRPGVKWGVYCKTRMAPLSSGAGGVGRSERQGHRYRCVMSGWLAGCLALSGPDARMMCIKNGKQQKARAEGINLQVR